MVAPVVSYPEEIQGSPTNDLNSYILRRKRSEQSRPFNLPLNYRYIYRRAVKLVQEGYPQAYNLDMYNVQSDGHSKAYSFGPYNDDVTLYQRGREAVIDKCLSRLYAKVSDPASLGITLVQYGQAADMVSKRLKSLLDFARAMRRFDLASAKKALGVLPPHLRSRLSSTENRLKNEAKHYADNFLEWHFGWSPLIKDAYQALEVLNAPIPYGRVKASAKVYMTAKGPVQFLNFYETLTSDHTLLWRCKAGCEVRVTNPNLHLLNGLGLLNPAEIAWDAIPWSFLLGWVSNVGLVMSQMSAFAGCEISNGYHVISLASSAKNNRQNSYPGYQGASQVYSRAFSLERVNSLPSATLAWTGVKLPSVTRGLTAMSLLAQTLKVR